MKPFINLLLYGNFWIALCATSLVWLSDVLLFQTFDPISPLSRFVFSSTLFIYAAHRIVGLEKVSKFQHQGRFLVIVNFKRHIRVYAIIGAIGGAWYYFQLSSGSKWLMIPAGIISLAYVLPVWTGMRLRDVHYIKIFLIALVFSVVTVLLPVLEQGGTITGNHVLMLLERCLFLLAITLPFDIRDIQIDSYTSVKTIPHYFGIEVAMRIALILLGMTMLLGLYLRQANIYGTNAMIGYLVGLFLTGILIYYSPRQKHDYYFSGLLDGSMLFLFLGAWLGMILL